MEKRCLERPRPQLKREQQRPRHDLMQLSSWDLLKLGTTCTRFMIEFGDERAELTYFILGNWKLRNFIQGAEWELLYRLQSGWEDPSWGTGSSATSSWETGSSASSSDHEEASSAHFNHVVTALWLRQHGQ